MAQRGKIKDAFGKSYCTQGGIVQCDYSRIIANGITVFHGREILQMKEFAGQSCFKIAHLDEYKVLRNPSRRNGTIQVRGAYTVHKYHPICKILWERYGKGRKGREN